MAARTLIFVLVGLVGATVTPIYVASWDLAFVHLETSNRALAKAQLWFLTLSVQGAAWAVCAVLLGLTFQQIWHQRAHPTKRTLLGALVPALVLISFLGVYGRAVGKLRPDKLATITLNQGVPVATVGVTLAVIAVGGMFLAGLQLWQEAGNENFSSFEVYEFYESQMHLCLTVAAIILSLGIVGTAALRAAANAQCGASYFPQEFTTHPNQQGGWTLARSCGAAIRDL